MSQEGSEAAAPAPVTLSSILSELETAAKDIVTTAVADGKKFVQEVVPVVESEFGQVLQEWGGLAITTVTNIATDEVTGLLSGTEKQNLAATTIVDAAAKEGVEIATPHLSALIEFALAAVKNVVGVYRTPLVEVETKCVLTNTTPVSAYRGAGRPEGNYFMERIIDVAAREMGIDRLELRRVAGKTGKLEGGPQLLVLLDVLHEHLEALVHRGVGEVQGPVGLLEPVDVCARGGRCTQRRQ